MAGQMGDILPAVDLGTGRTATAIAAGGNHTCAILDTGAVKCWGENGSGQLGQGNTADRGDGPGEMGDDLAPIDLGTGRTATAIAAGAGHTCAVLDDGDDQVLGPERLRPARPGRHGDTRRRPGRDGRQPRPDPISCRTRSPSRAGQLHTCALFASGDVYCWGQNVLGQLGQENTNNWGDGGTRRPQSDRPRHRPHRRRDRRRRLPLVRRARRRHRQVLGRQRFGQPRTGRHHHPRRRRRRDGRRSRRDRPRHRPHRDQRRPPGWSTRARCSTTELPSVGVRTPSGSSVASTRATSATAPARWATASPPSTSAPVAPPRRSPAGPTTRARCWTAAA